VAGAFVVVLVVVLVASVDLDKEGVRGTVIGAGLGIVNLAAGYLVMRRAIRQSMKTALMTVAGGMIARLFVVAGLMVLFRRTGTVDPAAFAITFLVLFFVYLGLEVLLVERSLDSGRSARPSDGSRSCPEGRR
jgi:threonine/homoserine/homoserine lactone efflux protein